MAARFHFNLKDSCPLLLALIRRVGRLDSALGKIFSPVQPGLDACERRRRAARNACADGQSRRARLWNMVSVGDGIVQSQRVVFHVRDAMGQRRIHKNPRLIFLRARAVVGFNRNLLCRSRRDSGRLAENCAEKNFLRGAFGFDRGNLFLAMGKFTRRSQINNFADGNSSRQPSQVIFPARTTMRSSYSEIFPAQKSCCSPIWAAPVKAHCSKAQMICKPTLSSPVCRTKASRFAARCWTRSSRRQLTLPIRNFRQTDAWAENCKNDWKQRGFSRFTRAVPT